MIERVKNFLNQEYSLDFKVWEGAVAVTVVVALTVLL
jgi:hypothetical protein